jgi:hypothetical protein
MYREFEQERGTRVLVDAIMMLWERTIVLTVVVVAAAECGA